MQTHSSICSYAAITLVLAAAACTGDPSAPPEDSVATVQSAVVRPPVTRRLAVLLLHYGQPLEQGPDFFRHVVFTGPDSVKSYYLDVSHGAVNLEGDVFNWIPTQRATVCDDQNEIKMKSLAAAAAAGIDLSSYDHVAFVLADFCRTGGQADIGTANHPAKYSVYWANLSEFVFAHELGHNLGLVHAFEYECATASILPPNACSQVTGTAYDLMGAGYVHLNAFNQAQERWLDGCNLMTVAPQSAEFTLAPIELGTNEVQALRIRVGNGLCAFGDAPCYYYIEYRQPIGWDAKFGTFGMFRGALVYLAGEIDPGALRSTLLLDMHPPTTAGQFDFSDAALRVGETFTDFNGIQITAVSETAQRLRVRVQVPGGNGQATCVSSPVTATFNLSSQSATQYCGDIMVRNNTAAVISNWRVDVNLRQSNLLSNWNSVFTPLGGSSYAVTPPAWNRFIQPGQSVAAGMCASKTGPNFLPLILSAGGS